MATCLDNIIEFESTAISNWMKIH